jgi:hypothetical protein
MWSGSCIMSIWRTGKVKSDAEKLKIWLIYSSQSTSLINSHSSLISIESTAHSINTGHIKKQDCTLGSHLNENVFLIWTQCRLFQSSEYLIFIRGWTKLIIKRARQFPRETDGVHLLRFKLQFDSLIEWRVCCVRIWRGNRYSEQMLRCRMKETLVTTITDDQLTTWFAVFVLHCYSEVLRPT